MILLKYAPLLFLLCPNARLERGVETDETRKSERAKEGNQ